MKSVSKASMLIFLFLFSTVSYGQWQGTWNTGFGQLRLVQNGLEVYGDYSKKGTLEGKYDSKTRTLKGTFDNQSQNRKGSFEFVLNNDAKSFSGKWGWETRLNGGAWNGTRSSAAQPVLSSPEFTVWQGTWNTKFGPLRLHQTGKKVFGDYAALGIIDANYHPATGVLEGIFTNNGQAGSLKFTLSSDKKSFSGTWRLNTQTGNWDGSKTSDTKPQLTSDNFACLNDDGSSDPRSANIRLPFHQKHQKIFYEVDKKGQMVFQGDIILGEEQEVLNRHANGKNNNWYQGSQPNPPAMYNRPGKKGKYQTRQQGLTSVKDTDLLWPFGIIPFVIDPGITGADRQHILTEIANLERVTSLKIVPRIAARHPDYVYFIRDPQNSGCGSSAVGRQGKRQNIYIHPNCFSGRTVIHEILHAAGVWHEQSRPDRDNYVRIQFENIACEGNKHNFEKHLEDGLTLTEYDYKSIMHYSSTAFAKPGTETIICNPLKGDCPDPGDFAGSRLSRLDILGINRLYPTTMEVQGGHDWGGDVSVTGIQFGDIDGDNKDEVGVIRKSGANNRIFVYDDAENQYKLMFSDGGQWGKDNYPTDIAFGDVNNDGKEEMAVTRKAGSSSRIYIYQYKAGTMNVIGKLGSEWGGDTYATGVAFGDVDGDRKDELGVTRKTDVNSRVFLYKYNPADQSFNLLSTLGADWGNTASASAIAFGDFNGDRRDELAIGRKAGKAGYFRYAVYEWKNNLLNELASGGHQWGTDTWVTDLAFGEVTGDSNQELGITRNADANSRAFIVGLKNVSRGSSSNETTILKTFGQNWGSGTYATSIEFGDTDGDGVDEILIGRKAGTNGRVYLYDDRKEGYENIFIEGKGWFTGYEEYRTNIYATSVGLGDANGDNILEFGVGLSASPQGQPRWHIFK